MISFAGFLFKYDKTESYVVKKHIYSFKGFKKNSNIH